VLGLRLHGAVLPGPCNCSWTVWHLQWKSLVMSVAYNDKCFATTVNSALSTWYVVYGKVIWLQVPVCNSSLTMIHFKVPIYI